MLFIIAMMWLQMNFLHTIQLTVISLCYSLKQRCDFKWISHNSIIISIEKENFSKLQEIIYYKNILTFINII